MYVSSRSFRNDHMRDHELIVTFLPLACIMILCTCSLSLSRLTLFVVNRKENFDRLWIKAVAAGKYSKYTGAAYGSIPHSVYII